MSDFWLDLDIDRMINELQETIDLGAALKYLYNYCLEHPTCENCQFWAPHKGCKFRNSTPREWLC